MSIIVNAVVIGEDVRFGGVFRCTANLLQCFGAHRIIDAPINESGIVGWAIGHCLLGGKTIAEIQFADYVFPAFDQITNEMAKMRYRTGNQFNLNAGCIVRMPYGVVGHGGLYHSQSPEAYFAHTPGLKVIVPRDAFTAKGLLLDAIFNERNPVIFLEPKALYRKSVNAVPDAFYTLPSSQAAVVKAGNDATIVGWGNMLQVAAAAALRLETESNKRLSIELLDLCCISPLDIRTIERSVRKTRRLLICHEAPASFGVAAEIAATLQQRLESNVLAAPVARICGVDSPVAFAFERFCVPGELHCYEALRKLLWPLISIK